MAAYRIAGMAARVAVEGGRLGLQHVPIRDADGEEIVCDVDTSKTI